VESAEHIAQVIAYYDAHPINEDQILHTLDSKGIAREGLTEAILKDHDQDHFGGIEANDILAAKAGIAKDHVVLDVCSGMGGPARYLADRIGCRVVGLDYTRSRYLAAQRLTAMVRLEHLVSFEHGNALEMPFADQTFDVLIGQEAWCHVPEKPRLIAECVRMVKRGGVIAFTDILRKNTLTDEDMQRLAREMTFPSLETLDGYTALLEAQRCSNIARDDLSEQWTQILIKRLAMYRSLADETAAKFGTEHSRHWDSIYSFFVGLFGAGKLGGGRFVFRRD
jgi:ubiquinone/menaquinone biosynthesis C-methylase UbiE